MILKDYVGSIQDCNEAIRLISHDDPIGYVRRGDAKACLKKYNDAIYDYIKAIEIEPKHALAYYRRGITEIAMGRNNDACTDLRKALELGYKLATVDINANCK
jgi:tetratricopeptide (TPR) repeat protein